MKLSAAAAAALESALKKRIEGDVRFDAGARALYATDSSNYRQVPIGVVWPRTVDDIVETVRLCREHQASILPRGGGTSLAGQCCNVAVVIDTSRHVRDVLEIDPVRRTARVQPGLVLDDLQRAAAPHGLMFGPDPATHAWCTLGGMIGNNSCGVHSVVGGLTSDNVEELEVLTADGLRTRLGKDRPAAPVSDRERDIHAALRRLGDRHAEEIRRRFPPIPRRVSGYNLPALLPESGFDLARALVGSEGTCVTVLEATVRLIEAPRSRALLVLGFEDVIRAAEAVMPLLETGPIGLEGFDELILRNLRKKQVLQREARLFPNGEAWLLVEFGGRTDREAEDRARAAQARAGKGQSAPSIRLFTDPHERHDVWLVRESALGATAFVPGDPLTWEGWEDAAVAPERLGPYLRDFRALLDRYGYFGALYGHFGQGCVHTRTNFDLQSHEGIRTFRAFIDEAADLVIAHGGSLSGEHGDGQSRAELLPKMFGPSLVGAFREFKKIWDPDGLMNPGKVVDPYAITDNLRIPGYRPATPRTHFRLTTEGGMAGAAMRCVGVGKCRKTAGGTMCPSYMVTRDEQHSTRGRARLLFEMMQGETITAGWRSQEVKAALDLCLACKACKKECPVSVDMATYKAEFLAHYYEGRRRPLRAHLFGHIDRWASMASFAPALVNALAGVRPVTRRLQPLLGIAPERRLPAFARETFQRWMRRRTPPASASRSVVLWPDTFTNYFHPDIGRAAVEVLNRLAYSVSVPHVSVCCGRPLYDFGFLDSARAHIEHVLAVLQRPLADGLPIVVLEPSCFAVFRDEAVNFFPDRRDVAALSRQAVLFDEFIRPHAEEHSFRRLDRPALVHGHCHQKALTGMDHTAAVLSAVGVKPTVLDAGCCGMAGAFGFDAEHYDVSVQAGERILLPAVRQASPDTMVVADGFSCREQIVQQTGREAWHLAQVLGLAISQDPSMVRT